MRHKKLFLYLAFLIGALFFSSKVSAADISYCTYKDSTFILPFTIKVEITGFDSMYPMNTNKNYYYTNTQYVYDKDTCINQIEMPNIEYSYGTKTINNGNTIYYVTTNFYYSYNNTWYSSNLDLVYGTYSEIDTTPPIIKSSYDSMSTSTEKYMALDILTMNINAYDSSDGTLIPEIIYDSYSENYNIPGTYSVIFKACDYSNNCTTFNQIIKVIDTTPPTIEGSNTINSYMSNPLNAIQISSTLKAFDNIDGDISSSIFLVSSYYNLNYPGKYYMNFDVVDSSNNALTTPFKVTINYIDDISPTIEGPNKFISYLSSPLEVKSIISNLVAIDNIDNDVLKNVYIISDTYSSNKKQIGSYKLIVSCYDLNGNEALPYIITIDVVDDVPPTLEGNTSYISYLSNPINISTIKNKVIAFDNHDGNITHKIEIYNDTYSININKIGTYNISLLVRDNSDNISNILIIEITNIDDVLPIINGENYYLTTTSEKLSIHTITNSLIAIDNIDEDISNKIELNEDMYSPCYNVPGIYYITYYVCDNSGNISLPFKIKIIVNENMSFIKSINNSSLYFNNTKFVDESSILKILNINTNEYTSITTLENTYSNNYSNPGTYKVIFEIENTDYSKEYLEININVYKNNLGKTNGLNDLQEKKKETIFSYIISFFKNLFINLSNYIKSIFKR